MEMSRSWQELGVVDTIYEDDHEEEEEEEEEEDCFNSPTLSSSATSPSRSCSPPFPPSSLPPVLKNAVQEWSRAHGPCKPDVIIRVQEHCFPLHRDPITSQSTYLRRLLSESSDITVALPAGLTVSTFAEAIAFCYGSDLAFLPSNLAAAWAAADWLELTAEDGLAQRAEEYFFQEVATDYGRAGEVMRSCAALLGGGAGEVVALLVRCLEVLTASGGADSTWLADVAALPVDEFQVVVEAMRALLAHDHDLLYTVVDHYLENHKGKLTEEEKSRLCYNVNCTKLSHQLFMHLVQNPRLPLRFVVQAMLFEQLHSHHSMLLRHHATAVPSTAPAPPPIKNHPAGLATNMTLGGILQRDAVLRQSAHIRASMQATSIRIDSLERELAGLRCRLRRSEEAPNATAAVDRTSAKSASFRIPRGRHWDGDDVIASVADNAGEAKSGRKDVKGLKAKLVHGLKSLFRRPGNGTPSCGEESMVVEAPEGDNDEVLCKEELRHCHRRNQSTV